MSIELLLVSIILLSSSRPPQEQIHNRTEKAPDSILLHPPVASHRTNQPSHIDPHPASQQDRFTQTHSTTTPQFVNRIHTKLPMTLFSCYSSKMARFQYIYILQTPFYRVKWRVVVRTTRRRRRWRSTLPSSVVACRHPAMTSWETFSSALPRTTTLYDAHVNSTQRIRWWCPIPVIVMLHLNYRIIIRHPSAEEDLSVNRKPVWKCMSADWAH